MIAFEWNDLCVNNCLTITPNQHKEPINTARIRIPKVMIEFYECTLKHICSSIRISTKLTIDFQSVDTKRYRLTVPGDSFSHLILRRQIWIMHVKTYENSIKELKKAAYNIS